MATNESLKKVLLQKSEEMGANKGEAKLTTMINDKAPTFFNVESCAESKTLDTGKCPSKVSEENEVLSYLKVLLSSEEVKKEFSEVLREKAPQYLDDILNLVKEEKNLQRYSPKSIVATSKVAASLGLTLDKNLGYGFIIPRNDRTSFNLGYKGYIQLALRTNQYKAINVIRVYEGQLLSWNPLSEELKLEFHNKQSEAVIGYAGTFELFSGFKKTVYWTMEAMENHRVSFYKNSSQWNMDYDAMAMRIVTRNMLSKWGVLSSEMERAYSMEQKEENK